MKKHQFITVLLLSFMVALTGCGSVRHAFHSDKTQTYAQMHFNSTAEEYLHLAATSTPPMQQTYQLQAVERLIRDHKLSRARQIVSTINTANLPQEMSFQKELLTAKIWMASQKPQLTVNTLSPLNIPDTLSTQNQIEYRETLAEAHSQVGNIFESIYQRNLLDEILPTKQKRYQNQLAIWHDVQKLTGEEVNQYLSQPLNTNLEGWFRLAKLSNDANKEPQQFAAELNLWRTDYPIHPGNSILPSPKNNKKTLLTANLPKKIFLLLPLSGKFGENGTAIRNGFMATYYAYQAEAAAPTSVHITDTSDDDIVEHYQNAINDGADFIVGPLTKTNITQLTKAQRLTVPTLALSDISELVAPNLYHFGLSQHEEAVQVATHAFQDGHRNAIIIAPKTKWGQSVAWRFQNRWEAMGGTISDNLAFNNTKNLADDIRKLLHVSSSESRAKDLQKILNEKVRFVPRRRQDVDMIFLVSNTKQAHNIMPMLKYYYADNLPVYATSIIYSGNTNQHDDHDLDNIQFAEMPWVLDKLPKELKSIQDKSKIIWSKSFQKKPKMYALGVDAYFLASRINQMSLFPHLGINGATGTLYLSPNRHIYRELSWAKMRNGKAT